MLSIGLMSGTSMDGIDAALLETDGSENLVRELGHISIVYQREFKILLKAAEYGIQQCVGDVPHAKSHYMEFLHEYLRHELGGDANKLLRDLSHYLQPLTFDNIVLHSTHLHEIAILKLLKQTGFLASQIDVVGYHGQTLFHRPAIKTSIIVGNGQHLADAVGITVVNDFRSRDVAAGGQGAPFAPLYHQALAIRDKKTPTMVVNCGGIANITMIPNANTLDLMAFDTGPGNGLIDRLVRQRTQGKEHMDQDGQYGKKGTVDQKILKLLYEKAVMRAGKNYFFEDPPKCLDSGDLMLIPELANLSIENACATLAAFTADAIVSSFKTFIMKLAPTLQHELTLHWILAGGGWHNPVIRAELDQRLKNNFGEHIRIVTADQIGWSATALEAQIFAYHAVRSLQNKPLSLPKTTRVPIPMSGGHVYLPKNGATKAVENLLRENPRQ